MSELSPEARAIIDAAREVGGPSAVAKAKVKAALVARVGGAPASGGAASAGGAAGAGVLGGGAALKGGVIAALVASALWAGWRAVDVDAGPAAPAEVAGRAAGAIDEVRGGAVRDSSGGGVGSEALGAGATDAPRVEGEAVSAHAPEDAAHAPVSTARGAGPTAARAARAVSPVNAAGPAPIAASRASALPAVAPPEKQGSADDVTVREGAAAPGPVALEGAASSTHARPREASAAPAPAALPAAPAVAPSADVARASALAEELALIEAAERALAEHRAGDARAALERHAARFPGGVLREERIALLILWACAEAPGAAASREAAAFARTHPGTPLGQRIEAECGRGRR